MYASTESDTATARATRPTRPKPRPPMPGPAATRMAIASTKAPSGTRARIRRKTLAFNAVLPSTSGRDAAGAPTPPPRVVGTRANAQADADRRRLGPGTGGAVRVGL